MSPEEYKAAIDRTIQEVEARNREQTLRIGFDLTTAIKLRIQRSGIDSEGKPLAPYTDKYKKYGRRRLGYQDRYVDLTREGAMWRSVRPHLVETEGAKTQVEIRASDQANQDKINGQFKKRGNVLKPSKAELEKSARANQAWINDIMAKNGLI